MRRVVVVGAGLAGLSAAEELRRRGFDGQVTIVGAEHHRPYRRPPLSKHPLPTSHADVALAQADHLEASWMLGVAAQRLEPARRVVHVGDGVALDYDGLVVATGSRARQLPVRLHRNLPEVLTLRGLDDLQRLRDHVSRSPRVVIIGAGFLGSELASTLRAQGLTVSLVESAPLPLIGALGTPMAQRVTRAHEEHGVRQHLGRSVAALLGAGRLEAVRLDDDTIVPADLLIVAMGAEPDTGWLRGSGIPLDDGVLVDHVGVAAPGIVAAGDVARWPHPWDDHRTFRVEHYNGALSQGSHVAGTLLGDARPQEHLPSFSAHIHGLRIHSVGFTGARYRFDVVRQGADDRFLAEYRDGDRVVGAITHGHVRDLVRYRSTMTAERGRSGTRPYAAEPARRHTAEVSGWSPEDVTA